MADCINNGDFCFPNNFLPMNKENMLHQPYDFTSFTCFPADFPYEFSSCSNSEALSSPIDSVVSSSNETETETESDDDEMVDAMNREFARSSIQETKKFVDSTMFYAPEKLEKTWAMFDSPQSSLIGNPSWSSQTAIASNVSSKSPPRLLSSLKTPLYTEKECLDFFYAAAARKMARSIMFNQGHPPIGASRKPLEVAPQPMKNHSSLFHSNESFLISGFAQRQQFLQMKQNLMNQQLKMCAPREDMFFPQQRLIHEQHQMQNGERSFGGLHGVRCCMKPLGMHEAAWPPLKTLNQNTDQQKYNSSGTRAAPLGGSIGHVKRECSGTGVFLPRQYNNHTQSRKKPGCSTALLPQRVVQALNLNAADMDSKPKSHFHGGFTSDYEALVAKRNPILMQQPRSFNPEAATAALSHEVSLPQEWTY